MGYKSHISDPDCEPSWQGFLLVVVCAAIAIGVYKWTGSSPAGVFTFILLPFGFICAMAELEKRIKRRNTLPPYNENKCVICGSEFPGAGSCCCRY